jgi:hypothetical protein
MRNILILAISLRTLAACSKEIKKAHQKKQQKR